MWFNPVRTSSVESTAKSLATLPRFNFWRYNAAEVLLKTVKAIYENGVFKPREPIHLEEHAEVEVLIPAPAPTDDDDPTGWKAAEALIGFIDDAPADMAERHGDYRSGATKA